MDVSIDLVRYTEEQREKWNDFISVAKNSTFLHTREFYDHNPLNAEDDHSLMFFKQGKLVAVFPANMYEKEGKVILHSYLRSTYGGLVVKNGITIAELVEIVRLLKELAIEHNISEVINRQPFSIFNETLSDEVGYAFWHGGFSLKNRELELAIDMRYDVRSNYNSSTLRSVKKALKSGVVIVEDGDIEAYWKILEQNLKERYGTKPVHSLEDINRLISLVGADKVKLFTAVYEGVTIGGIFTFVSNSRVIHSQYIALDNNYQEYRPLNAVIDHIANWAKEHDFRYFNLGMATEPGGEEINAGLFRFKEGFGARGVYRDTLHLVLNN